MNQEKKKILIVAGGTGGHILPALCLAEALKEKHSSIEIECVHGFSDLEKKIYEKYPFRCHLFSVGRLRKNVPWKEKVKTFFLLPYSLLKALKLILKIQPHLVFGTGGAVSGPLLLASFFLRKKTIIWEPNIVPGLSNRWLSRFVNEAIVVFEETKKYLYSKRKVKFAFPVRSSIASIQAKQKEPRDTRDTVHLLVLGGSQGSSLLNKVVSQTLLTKTNWPLSVIHQSGQKDFHDLKNLYNGVQHVKVVPFLDEMDQSYEWADIVISRAGIGTLAELSCVGRATILVPLRHSADQHQLKNALFLKEKSATILIEEGQMDSKILKNCLEDLIHQPQNIFSLASRIYELRLGGKAHPLASYILSFFDGVS